MGCERYHLCLVPIVVVLFRNGTLITGIYGVSSASLLSLARVMGIRLRLVVNTQLTRPLPCGRGCVGFDATRRTHYPSPFTAVVGPPAYGVDGRPNIASSLD